VVELVLEVEEVEIFTYYTAEGDKTVYIDDNKVGYFDRRLWTKWMGGTKACGSEPCIDKMLAALRELGAGAAGDMVC
jgi:hypothetical protein